MDLSWTLLESMSHRLATKKSWYFFLVILVLLINVLVEVCVIQQLYNFLQLLWFLSLPRYIVFVLIFTVVKVFHVHQCVHCFLPVVKWLFEVLRAYSVGHLFTFSSWRHWFFWWIWPWQAYDDKFPGLELEDGGGRGTAGMMNLISLLTSFRLIKSPLCASHYSYEYSPKSRWSYCAWLVIWRFEAMLCKIGSLMITLIWGSVVFSGFYKFNF
jgi:hypothetical protein